MAVSTTKRGTTQTAQNQGQSTSQKPPRGYGRYGHSTHAYRHRVIDFGSHRSAANRSTRRNWAWTERIRTRAFRRRIPWLAAGGVAATAALAWGATSLYATAAIPAAATSGVLATFPGVYAGIAATRAQPHVGRWKPDLALAAFAGGGLVFWVGMCGPSWWSALTLLVGTITLAGRWWHAHPVGPDTESLQPAPEPAPAPAPPPPERDPYVTSWDHTIAGEHGKLPGSWLTNRVDDEHTITYAVHLKPGRHTFDDVQTNAAAIAGGLGLNRKKLIFERGGADQAENVAAMTIIVGDPVAAIRYYTGPTIVDGEARDLARYTDGGGQLNITMWDNDGTKSVAIAGGMGGGKSAASNQLTLAGLSTGALNLCYIDPKGNSSTALVKRARIALVGQEAALRAPELMQALATARGHYAGRTDQDVLLPSPSEPGWMVLHDEFSYVSGDTKTRTEWARLSNIVRALGLWLVGINQALHASKWGDDQTRAAFAQQLIAFRINSTSDGLIPGLEYRPRDLPVNAKGNTIPGYAIQAGVDRSNVPALWDHLPRDNDDTCPDAPYRVSEAFDTFFNQPEMLAADYQAIVSVLGEPNANGTWIVGGARATHQFPDKNKKPPQRGGSTASGNPGKPTGFGLNATDDTDEGEEDTGVADELPQVQRDVLAVIRGGTTQVGAIVEAAHASRSSVNDALAKLSERGLITRVDRGQYEATDQY